MELAMTLVLVLLTLTWLAQAYPQEDLVVRLPGQPRVEFKQYAGYVDVDLKSGKSLFYYYVEAIKQPDTKPLTLWLNGGPGCSSVGGGAFTELGPFYPTGDGRGLRINSMSWNRVSNMLFVDSPAGVGWSYSNRSSDYNTGDESTAKDMLVFLLRWFEKFQELKSRDLFLTGESYAGHYIPQVVEKILSYNSHSRGFKFNIKSIALGNPLLNVNKDAASVYEYFWSHGLISDEVHLSIKSQCNFEDYKFAFPHNVSLSCQAAIGEVGRSLTSEYINPFDVLLDVCHPLVVHEELRHNKMATRMSMGVDACLTYERRFYFNLPEVQHAFHANRTHLPYGWSMCSSFLNYSGIDGNIDMIPALKRIIQKQIPVWIFSGDQDSVVPLLGTRTLIRELALDLNINATVPYGAWFHKTQVGGWTIEYGNILTFATVRGAGHTVPYTQPSRALQLFRSFVGGQRLPNKAYISADED